MEAARSSFQDAASTTDLDNTALADWMHTIQGEFLACDYRRITVQLRADARGQFWSRRQGSW